MNVNFQNKLYTELYQKSDYLNPLPDMKITNGINIKGKNILTLGSGNGRDIWHLAKDNEITAIDNTKSVVNILKTKGIKVKVMDLDKNIPFGNQIFDIVIAKDILEHIQFPLEICREIRRVIKPEGYAVINVPNHFCLPMRLKYLFGGNLIWKTPGINHENIFSEWNYMHIRFFTWKGFQNMLSEAGLIITRTYFDLFTLNHYTDPELMKIYFSNHKYSPIINKALNLFGFIFPLSLRRSIAGLNTNLLSGSFYVWVKPV